MLGRTLSHYRIKEKLGAGGMGEVYGAEDTRLKRDVALKVLPPELASDPERLGRFRREAQTLAAIDHPGIVTIFSVEEAEGVQFFTMQLVHGRTLNHLIRPGGLAIDQFIDVAIQLTDAVAAAHEKGVIHRDIKPSNVMLTPEGRVKVLDFGLAKLAESDRAGSDNSRSAIFLSSEGLVVGSLPYMSPEQISGKIVDHRTDIFSIGIVLYEIVSGRHPFSGATATALMWAIHTEEPEEVEQLRAGLPQNLSAVIAHCLKKEAAHRIQTVRELHTLLRNLQKEVSTGTLTHANIGTAPYHPINNLSSVAVLPFASLSADPDDEFLADGVSEEIINALGRLPDLKVVARTSAFSFKGKNEDLRVIGEKLGVSSVLEGSLRRAGKRLRISAQLVDVSTGYHLWSERYDRQSADVFDIQDEIARSIASRLTATLIGSSDTPVVQHGTNDVDAFQMYNQGRGLLEQRTQDEMRRGVSCFQRAVQRDPKYALAWAGLADGLVLIQDYYGYAIAEDLLPQAREAIDRSLQLDPDLAEAHASLGLLHIFRKEGTAAVEELSRAVQRRPGYAEAHNWLSWTHLLLGNAKPALESAKRSVELNPLSPEALSNLSVSYLVNDEYQQALREARRAKEIQPYFDSSSFYEAVTLYHMKRFEESKAILPKLSVPWAGLGSTCTVALAEVALNDTVRVRDKISQMKEANEFVCAGLLHLSIGEQDLALQAFDNVKQWDYWPTLSILHLYKDLLGPLRDSPRYQTVIGKAQAAWRMTPQ